MKNEKVIKTILFFVLTAGLIWALTKCITASILVCQLEWTWMTTLALIMFIVAAAMSVALYWAWGDRFGLWSKNK